jgi:hypothetical protein
MRGPHHQTCLVQTQVGDIEEDHLADLGLNRIQVNASPAER